jgi:hypothetical protein
MHYGQRALEVIVAQALILVTFMVIPSDVLAGLSPIAAGLIVTAITGTIGTSLYIRHRNRRSFSRKLETLRSVPVA